jgi:putative hydrolase of the HAD superfamily
MGVRSLANPAALRAVCFDAVGTLIYPSPPVREIYGHIGRRHGAILEPDEIDQRFRAAFRRQDEQDRRRGYRTDEDRERQRWAAIVAEVFHDQPDPIGPLAELWDHFAQADAWACFADVAPCLGWLKAHGFQVGIASNYDHRLRSVVAGLPPLKDCDSLAISAELGWRKPALSFFTGMLQAIQQPAERVLLVGDDWENDYLGGTQAGLQVVLVERQHRESATPALTSLEELPRLLQPMLD